MVNPPQNSQQTQRIPMKNSGAERKAKTLIQDSLDCRCTRAPLPSPMSALGKQKNQGNSSRVHNIDDGGSYQIHVGILSFTPSNPKFDLAL
jgi:hypothetical protein